MGLRDPGSYVNVNYPTGLVPGDTTGRYFWGSGNSQAAAITSGAAALLLQQRLNLTPDQVKKLLVGTTDAMTSGNVLGRGSGQLNVKKAIEAPTPRSRRPGRRRRAPAPWRRPVAPRTSRTRSAAPSWPARRTSWAAPGPARPGRRRPPPAPRGPARPGRAPRLGGNTTTGRSWVAVGWSGTNWAGRTWSQHTWSGRTWSSAVWDGRTWSGRTWSGSTWSGRTWSGSYWSASLWR